MGALALVAALTATTVVGCGSSAAPAATRPAATAKPTVAAGPARPTSAPAAAKPSPTADPAGRTAPEGGACPESHQIKGQTTGTNDKIYYEPNRPEYPSIAPEICFTAGGDARAAGYRSSRQ